MFERMSRGWELTKQSLAVLRQDKHLLVFPILSSIACLLIMISFAVPVMLSVDWSAMAQSAQAAKASGSAEGNVEFQMQPLYYVLLFLFYFCNYFIIAFFNSALVACAIKRFNGEETSVQIGLAAAGKRLPQILGWSLLNSTVGLVLQMISERAGLLGKIVIGLVGMVWTIATFFVVPVLVIEGTGPIESVKRSTQVLKKVWGEQLVANVGVGMVFGLLGLVVMLVLGGVGVALTIAFDSAVPIIACVVVGVMLITLLSLIGSTLKIIITAACYRFATTGLIAEQFTGDTLKSMFKTKGK